MLKKILAGLGAVALLNFNAYGITPHDLSGQVFRDVRLEARLNSEEFMLRGDYSLPFCLVHQGNSSNMEFHTGLGFLVSQDVKLIASFGLQEPGVIDDVVYVNSLNYELFFSPEKGYEKCLFSLEYLGCLENDFVFGVTVSVLDRKIPLIDSNFTVIINPEQSLFMLRIGQLDRSYREFDFGLAVQDGEHYIVAGLSVQFKSLNVAAYFPVTPVKKLEGKLKLETSYTF